MEASAIRAPHTCGGADEASARHDGNAVQRVRAHVARLHALVSQLNGTQQERERAMDQLALIDDQTLSSAADEHSQATHGACGAFERGRLDYISRCEAHKPSAQGFTACGPMRAAAAAPRRPLTAMGAPAASGAALPWHLVAARLEPQRASSIHANSAALHMMGSDVRRLRLATGEPDSGACAVAVSQGELEAYHRGRNEFNSWAERQRLELAHARAHPHLGMRATEGEMHRLGYFDPLYAPPLMAPAPAQQLAALSHCQSVAKVAQRSTGKGKRKSPA